MAENISASLGWQLADAVRAMTKRTTGPTTGTAQYVGRDSAGNALILLPGADQATPVQGAISASAEVGSTVTYSLANGRLSITGNASDPAVGEAKATQIADVVVKPVAAAVKITSAAASAAKSIADAAQRVASAINQHFWSDTDGVHVTQVSQEEWQDSEGTSYQSGPNVLINSLGQLFRDGTTNLLTMTTESGARALAIWDGAGNAASNILASFGEVVRIGRSTSAHIEQSGTKTMFYIAALAKPILSIGGNGSGRIGRIDFYDSESSITGNESQIYIGSSGASDSKSVSIESNYTGGSTSKGSHVIASAGSSGSDVTISAYGTGNGVQVVFDSKDGVAIRNNKQTIHNSSGDSTVSGNVVTVESTSNSNPVSLLASSSSSNRGLYDNVSSQWIVRAGSNNDVYLNGHNVSDVEDHKFFAAPSGGGDAYFREIWASDIPNGMAASKITSSGPTNLTLNSASQAYSSGKTPKYRKWGNVVSVYGAVSPKTQVDAGGTLAIGTLPSGYRPPMDMEWLCQGSGNSVWLLSITTAGVLTASRYRNGASANAAMPTSAWLTFSVTFIVG